MYKPLKKHGLFFKAIFFIALSSLLGACANAPQPSVNEAAPIVKKTKAIPLPDGSLFELLQAETAARRGLLSQALPLFAHQVELTQSLALAKTTARLANHLQQYETGIAAIELWLKQEPQANPALDLKARALIYQQQPIAAFDFILAQTSIEQQNLLVLLATETAKTNADQLAALSQQFETALVNQPKHIGLLLGLGLLQDTAHYDRAKALLEKAHKLNPDNTVVISVLAALFAQTGQLDDAVGTLQHGLRVHPNHFGMKRQLGRILSQTDIVAARSIFKDLLEIAPNDSETLFILAQISVKLEFYQEASLYLTPLQNQAQYTDFAHYNLGLIAEHGGEQFIALNHYGHISDGPYLLTSLDRYGKLAAQLSGIKAYEQRLEGLKTNNPDKALTLTIYHIEYLLGLGLNERAKPIVEAGLANFGNDSKLLYGQFLIAEQQQDYPLATSSLREILLQQPDNPVILNALGYTLSRHMQRHTEAEPFISQALALKPNDAAIIDSMGWVLLKLGNVAEATEHLIRAYTQSSDTEIAAHLGEALWLGNERDQAMDVWREAYKSDATNSELQDVLQRLNISLPPL